MSDRIGVIVGLRPNEPLFDGLVEMGLKVCQLASWEPENWTDEIAKQVRDEAKKKKIRMTSFWAGWAGPAKWNLIEGPTTLGFVPKATRKMRTTTQKIAGDFAVKIGVPAVITHLGFIPEPPLDPDFKGAVDAVRDIALYYKKLGLEFWFETGQETPVTMLRMIQSVGTDNLGINLDPANLILYGKGNPIDALDVFGKYVRNIHSKDAFYPTDPMKLGEEVKVGEGRVRFPEFVKRLDEVGFKGEFIIEREISGEQQRKDIAETVKYLKKLIKEK
jgi:L-ribulose-5-phosphate 3-epimerase